MRSDASAIDRLSMPQFLDRVLAALGANDAAELHSLAERVHDIEAPTNGPLRFAALSRQRLLASALGQIGRNLRMLRRAHAPGGTQQFRDAGEFYGAWLCRETRRK